MVYCPVDPVNGRFLTLSGIPIEGLCENAVRDNAKLNKVKIFFMSLIFLY